MENIIEIEHLYKSFGFPSEVMKGIRDGIDCNLYFNGNIVSTKVMATVLISSIVFFTGLFVLFNILKKSSSKGK